LIGSPQIGPLPRLESRGKAGDLAALPRPAQERHRHDAQERADAEAGVFAARVGRVAQHFPQAAPLLLVERQHAMGGRDAGTRLLGGERDGAHFRPSPRAEFLHPEPFRTLVGHKIIRAMPAAACAHAHGFPAAGLVIPPLGKKATAPVVAGVSDPGYSLTPATARQPQSDCFREMV